MSNVREINPSAPAAANCTAERVALLETRLALLRVQVVLQGAKYLGALTSEQYIRELSWRVGYAASRMDQLMERLDIIVPQEQPKGSAPNA